MFSLRSQYLLNSVFCFIMSALLGSAKEIPEIGDTFVSFAGIEFKVVKNGESNKKTENPKKQRRIPKNMP